MLDELQEILGLSKITPTEAELEAIEREKKLEKEAEQWESFTKRCEKATICAMVAKSGFRCA